MEPAPEAPLLGRLLPMLQVLSLVCLAIAALGVIAVEGVWSGFSAVVAIVYLGSIPVVAALWIARARQRSARRRALLSLVVSAVLLPVDLLCADGFMIWSLLLSLAMYMV